MDRYDELEFLIQEAAERPLLPGSWVLCARRKDGALAGVYSFEDREKLYEFARHCLVDLFPHIGEVDIDRPHRDVADILDSHNVLSLPDCCLLKELNLCLRQLVEVVYIGTFDGFSSSPGIVSRRLADRHADPFYDD